MNHWYVYILASKRNGTLYVGVTNNLARRIDQHHTNNNPRSFTARYHVQLLVYYEIYSYPDEAIHREKNLKAWKRRWKLELIESINPAWNDLSFGPLD